MAKNSFNKTDHRKVKKESLRNEIEMDVILDSLMEHVIYHNKELCILWANQAAIKSSGLSRKTIAGRHCYEIWAQSNDPCEDCPVIKAMQSGKNHEVEKQTPDGKYWSIRGYPVKNKAGHVIGGIEVTLDISDKKVAEKALRESEAKYRSLIQNSEDAIYLLYDRKFEIINNKFQEIFGVTLNEVNHPDFDFINLVAPQSRALVEERVNRLAQGEALNPKYEFVALDAAGNEITVEASVSYIKYKEGIATQGILRDITERKRLEQHLMQSQKMESIGRMAAGIAHDFNNLLTVINGYSELLLSAFADDDVNYVKINQIKNAGEQAAALTNQLLAFSRKQMIQPRIVDLNLLISHTEKMVRRLIGEHIELKTYLQSDLKAINIDPNQVDQILINLAVNARDAMPSGGQLIIETANVSYDKNTMLDHMEIKKGHYVLLKISDSGVGMDEETQMHIFEPFFTTKNTGEGTGLGLSTVYGIVKQNEGFIWVYSETGIGTTFKIYIPSLQGAVGDPEQEEKKISDLRGTENILVVEDSQMVRDLVSSILIEHGYKVISTDKPAEALKMTKGKKHKIDLLITDVVMPHMNGKELFQKLVMEIPDLKVLYISGYSSEIIAHHGVLDQGINFIQKPIAMHDVLKKLRIILDAVK